MRLGARLRCPFPPAGRGKGNHGTWHALAMAFSPCLSRKSPSWDLLCACDGLFSLLVEEKGSIVAKSMCPGSLLPLPQGKNAISKPIICRNVLCADRNYVSKHVACLRKHMGRSKRNIQQTERERDMNLMSESSLFSSWGESVFPTILSTYPLVSIGQRMSLRRNPLDNPLGD